MNCSPRWRILCAEPLLHNNVVFILLSGITNILGELVDNVGLKQWVFGKHLNFGDLDAVE